MIFHYNHIAMLDQLAKTLQKRCALDFNTPIVIGVSGGVDSLCLLDCMRRLGFQLIVAHLDHGIRSEANSDAQMVRQISNQFGLPFVLGEESVPDYSKIHNISIEEAAREVRYRFLFEQADIHTAQAVVVAHNADDQVETVLMHILRGSGLDGLSGMAYKAIPNSWSDSIPLIRPLLKVWRGEIELYCKDNNITPVFDQTNTDITFFRNRLRHELIPELEDYIPGIRQRLWQTADLVTADRDIINNIVEEFWENLATDNGGNFVAFNLPSFKLQSLGIQRRLIRKAVSQLRPKARDLDYSLVKRVLDFSSEPTATYQIDVGLGLRSFVEEERLVLAGWEADLPTSQWPQLLNPILHPVSIPGELDFDNDWVLKVEVLTDVKIGPKMAEENGDPFRTWIDLGNQKPHLNIRTRLPGDRFHPLGMGGNSTKLSDFMINLKIPRRARDKWPLVCVGDVIVWVPGYRSSHPFRLTGETKQVVLLMLARKAS